MKNIEKDYYYWKEMVSDTTLQKELQSIEGNQNAIKERFYKGLEFGTGGMRGLIGAGSNRINIYTIRKVTQGLAMFLNSSLVTTKNSVAIAYDSRHMSKEFALEAALVLVQNGIKAYVFENITPTPLLSYAVRELGCTAGIVITASHNPKEYNGYKVYNHHGGQITEGLATAVITEIEKINDPFEIKVADQLEAEKADMLFFLNDEFMDTFLDKTYELILNKDLLRQSAGELKIIYSPLHGTGLVPLTKLFNRSGFSSLCIVEQQAIADPTFPTVIYPNPEDQAACVLALQDAKKHDADIILLTDPDADRLGIVVKDNCGEYIQLTGNQTGALLIDYILQMRQQNNTLPPNGVIIKTIVTSNMGVEIASRYGVKYIDVLTGFKYIGEKIAEFELSNEYSFLFGYEESYGYLIGTYSRDKDAIQVALVLAEIALYHKKNESSIYNRLLQLFDEVGYFSEKMINIQLDGLEGQQKIIDIMNNLRGGSYEWLKPFGILAMRDYLYSKELDLCSGIETRIDLPSSNVIYFVLEEGTWCCIRPSGTEPKLKIYLGVKAKTSEASKERLEKLHEAVFEFTKSYMVV
ncbi:MAG: phosphoglucomutase [Firmicutes bacterium HGW-Firmicutes-12]|jgi:phosphoglucomutase|nr:MAG: phosphoglucomutase [Firmicutes bacterium HGW-Firmicutes-12]